MRTLRLLAVSVVGLALFACSSTDDAGATGGDQNVTEGAARPKPGLVKVTFHSTVGVLLDGMPDVAGEEAKLIAESAGGKKDAFWKARAIKQLQLTENRLYYRGSYYEGGLADDPENKATFEHPKKGQLPLPPEVDESGKSLWEKNITFTSEAKHQDVPSSDGQPAHAHVVREFTYEGYLLTDEASPGATEPALLKAGGVWTEPAAPEKGYALPVDPDHLLQRTGFACMTEAQFPPDSVDSENAYRFYDYTCLPDFASGCHTKDRALPKESCVAALSRTVGIVHSSVRFERMDVAKVTKEFLDGLRIGDPGNKAGADMTVRKDSLNENRIVWRYVGDDSCELKEENNCVTGPGWRRVLEFDAVGQNVGSKPVHIGPINYFAKAGMSSKNDEHGVFQFSSCHNHFHFAQYGTFTIGDKNVSNRKNGFCLESTVRYANSEFSPIETQYGRCTLQGVEVGWGDEYEAGIVCQWLDITNQSAGQVQLGFESNPDGFLCEGSLQDENGKPTFDKADARGLPTPFSAIEEGRGWENVKGADGKDVTFTPKDLMTGKPQVDAAGKAIVKPVQKPKCKLDSGWQKNNKASVPVNVPAVGGLVAGKCKDADDFGPLRDCGLQHETPAAPTTARACTPGAAVHLSCSTKAAKAQVVRFCEASKDAKIGGSMDCMQANALRMNPGTDTEGAVASVTVKAGAATDVTFTCPKARDAREPGGLYSVYTGGFFAADAAEGVSCDPVN